MAFNLDFLNKLKKQRIVPELEPALANAASAPTAAPLIGAGRKARGKDKARDATRPAASDTAGARFSTSMFRRFPLQYQMRILLGLLGGSLLLGSGAVWLNSSTSSVNSLQSQIAGNALMHSQRIGKAAPNAIQGNASAFSQLVDSRRELNTDLDVLANGG
ncbi:MAG: type IV pili methyl-accepting chemotaxis transducer N-terminal domain-containing protein, partial [Burkholderiaceae bacterium]